MRKCRISVMKISRHDDLIEKYENPISHTCDMKEGQIFISNGWESISPFVMTLSHGGENLYHGWMKNPKTAMISCNDGFRPVSFYIEAPVENADTYV